jgi:integrase
MALGTSLALKFQLVTAQRKGEVAAAEWAEMDLASGWWTIPAEKSKNKLPHRVPLSPLAIGLLTLAKEAAGNSPWVFPSPRDGGKKKIADTAIDRAVRNNRKIFGVDDFTPHDLRRTAASHMTGVGISRLVVAKILNHMESGITAVYDRHSYDPEKKRALDAWARVLDEIINGKAADNVIDMQR